MSDLMRYAAALEQQGVGARLPPIEKWNPDYCGALDLVIRRDGTWIHEGTPIGRAKLVRLFSTVIKREGDEYFLVTPVEKLSIGVEDVPFLAVLYSIENPGPDQVISFTTNVGDQVILDANTELTFRLIPQTDDLAPYIIVRRNLEARLARPVYYDLANLASMYKIDNSEQFGLWSAGRFFVFGPKTQTNAQCE